MILYSEVKIRFKDCDMMGHVNNAVYLSYIEEARIHFFNKLLGKDWDWYKNGVIVKKHEIEYNFPLNLNDNCFIETSVENIGNKSFILNHIIKKNNQITTLVKTTLVYFDYKLKTSKELTENLTSKLKLHV
jgi:acyl-CoA thioester hydrolase